MLICEPSFAQRREYMLYRLRDDHYPFNMQQYFTIPTFSEERFQRFLRWLIYRHEVLRTTLVMHGGQLRQHIHDELEFDCNFQYFSLLDKSEEEQVIFFNKHKSFQKHTSFNLEVGPLFRIVVFSVSIQLHVVLVTGHHVVFDDHSLKIFNKELQFFFSSDMQKKEALQVTQYRVFSDWENQLLHTSLGESKRRYHLGQLNQGIPQFDLIPPDKKELHAIAYLETIKKVKKRMSNIGYQDESLLAPVVRRFQIHDGGMITLHWDQSIRQGLSTLANQQRISLTAIFIGVFLKAITNISGQRSFVVDLPVSSRPSHQYQNTIGWLALQGLCFLNLSQEMSDKEIFVHIDERLFELYEHSDFPYELIGSSATPLPVGGDIPIFFNMTYMDGELHDVAFNKLEITPYGVDCYQQTALFVYVYQNGISMDFSYNNVLFEAFQIEELITTYQEEISKKALQILIL